MQTVSREKREDMRVHWWNELPGHNGILQQHKISFIALSSELTSHIMPKCILWERSFYWSPLESDVNEWKVQQISNADIREKWISPTHKRIPWRHNHNLFLEIRSFFLVKEIWRRENVKCLDKRKFDAGYLDLKFITNIFNGF